MFGSLQRSWHITKLSVSALRQDKTLMVFPILSAISVLVVLAVLLLPTALAEYDSYEESGGSIAPAPATQPGAPATQPGAGAAGTAGASGAGAGTGTGAGTAAPGTPGAAGAPGSATTATTGEEYEPDATSIVVGLLAVYLATALAIFFNVALASCAIRSLEGEDTTVGQGLSAAMGRLGTILVWALIATVVGLILRAVESAIRDRNAIAASIFRAIGAAAWSLATFFIIPVIALERMGPVAGLKRSMQVIRERWGSAVVGSFGINLVSGLAAVAVLVMGVGGGLWLVDAGQEVLGGILVATGIGLAVLASLVGTTVGQMYRVALYDYAVTGTLPESYRGVDPDHAFRTERPRIGRRGMGAFGSGR